MRWLLLLGVVACTTEDPTDPVPPNVAPTVELADATVGLGEEVVLAPVVHDPDADSLTYAWTLRHQPPLSRAMLATPGAPTVSFEADRAGAYVVDLIVSDGRHDVSSTAVVTAGSGREPIVVIEGDRAVFPGQEASFHALKTTDPDGARLYYSWALGDIPDGSTAELSSLEPTAQFVPDVLGDYEVVVIVTNGSAARSEAASLHVPDPLVDAGDVASGTLLPGKVYAYGYLGVACGYGFAHWSDTDTATGFVDQCQTARGPVMGPDGTAYYLGDDGVLRAWQCDGCPTLAPKDPLPADAIDNDPEIGTAPCNGTDRSLPDRFTVGANGRFLFYCDGQWRDDMDRTVADYPWTQAPWYGGTDFALTWEGYLMDFATGEHTPVAGWPTARNVAAARATTGGFWAFDGERLWLVDEAKATATLLYEYTELGVPLHFSLSAINAEGTVIQWANGAWHRRRLDGIAEHQPTSGDPTWMSTPQALITGP